MHLLLRVLGHGVKSATVLEPLDLALVEGVRKLDLERGASICGMNSHGQRLAGGELGGGQVDAVVGTNLVVVGRVGESKRKHTLLLQVGLVDTSERAGDDGGATQVPGLERGVFTGRALSVVVVTTTIKVSNAQNELRV
jgi:hypothetical protein